MGEFTLTITDQESGSRLDKFLREKFSEFSRHWLQNLIREQFVLVNGRKTEPSYILRNQDVIHIVLRSPQPISLEADQKIRFEIIYEDKDCIVINKPAGLVVHPSETTKNKTLVNGLLARWPQIEGVGEDPLRPGIVHRLDKETSGLLIIAKIQQAYEHLKFQFQNRLVVKRYLALVHGIIKDDFGVIEAPIMRSETTGVKQTIGGTKNATTFYKVRKRYKEFTFLELQPRTGRKHQIRVHCAYIGHPVVGDEKYTSKSLQETLRTNLIRHFLHAHYLELEVPSNKDKIFEADLPESLEAILKKLR
ncbi:RluA family pseudouridine synthase [Candidatus Parcubacteria bacterium]|nr:MAG: RluA family pseudouridine synthase [Candidatus Parcubacteria bacterium]